MIIETLIVDDEPLADGLLSLLSADRIDVEVVAKCENGQKALPYIRSKPINLILLDVQMPEMGYSYVVVQFGLHFPPTIFVTAVHEHAVCAFDAHVIEYLTKPVDAERLARSLERVRDKLPRRLSLRSEHHLTTPIHFRYRSKPVGWECMTPLPVEAATHGAGRTGARKGACRQTGS